MSILDSASTEAPFATEQDNANRVSINPDDLFSEMGTDNWRSKDGVHPDHRGGFSKEDRTLWRKDRSNIVHGRFRDRNSEYRSKNGYKLGPDNVPLLTFNNDRPFPGWANEPGSQFHPDDHPWVDADFYRSRDNWPGKGLSSLKFHPFEDDWDETGTLPVKSEFHDLTEQPGIREGANEALRMVEQKLLPEQVPMTKVFELQQQALNNQMHAARQQPNPTASTIQQLGSLVQTAAPLVMRGVSALAGAMGEVADSNRHGGAGIDSLCSEPVHQDREEKKQAAPEIDEHNGFVIFEKTTDVPMPNIYRGPSTAVPMPEPDINFENPGAPSSGNYGFSPSGDGSDSGQENGTGEVEGPDAEQTASSFPPSPHQQTPDNPAERRYREQVERSEQNDVHLDSKRGGADSELGRMHDRDQEFPDSVKGTPEFYKHPAEHYKQKYGEAPDYLMEYGDKYARKFAEIESELSPEGRKWVRNTMRALQDRMMDEIKKDPSIVRDPERFRDMAFETHSDAYLEGGLRNVLNGDLLKITQLPDIKEWMDWRTLKEAGEVGPYVIGPFLRRILENSQIGSPSIE